MTQTPGLTTHIPYIHNTITRPAGPVTVGERDRSQILIYASRLVPRPDREDPAQVLAVAAPLLEWAGQATDRDDLRARMDALDQQYFNLKPASGSSQIRRGPTLRRGLRRQHQTPPVPAPAEFIDAAAVLYVFLRGEHSGAGEA